MMREEFEKWAKSVGYVVARLDDGTYCYSSLEMSWRAWQAAWRLKENND